MMEAQRNLEPKFQRRLFLSHVDLAAVDGVAFSRSTRPDLNELYGNIYIDLKNGNLCLNCENVYLEVSQELLSYWLLTRVKLIGSR